MENKVCTKCEKEKLSTEFNFRNKALGIRNNCCRECTKNYYTEFYSNNKEKEKARAYKNTLLIRERNRDFIIDFLSKNPCVDCGETDIVTLDFDHVRGEKYKDVSKLAWSCCGLELIQKEIDKCDVRCSNCHRRKTAKQFGYWKYFCSIGVAG